MNTLKTFLTKKDLDLISEYLGQLAIKEAEKGNEKREKRIFDLINKIEHSEIEKEI